MLAALLFLSAATASANSSPVSKVIKLLRDMQGQLEADKAKEEEMFDKLSCWCKVNGEGKTTAVETATQQLAALDSRIKSLEAKASELEMSIKGLEEEVASNKASLASATKMREEEHAEFNANEKDLTLSIDSLKNALTVLTKSQGGTLKNFAFLETKSLVHVKAQVRGVVDKTEELLNQILTPTDRNALNAFVQAPGYAPQSGEIMGILKQMREQFAENLKDMQGQEGKASAEYAALKSAKQSEIAAGEKLIKEKTATLGKTKVETADAKEDHEDTTAAMTSDQAFLVDLKERCSVSDAEWEERAKTRAKEIQAVSEAVGILSEDDAHDLFHKSLSFLQLSSHRRVVSTAQRAREAASRILLRQAQKTNSKVLVQLAASARLDAFTTVAKSIEGMVSDLKRESADEIKHKDWCNDEFHSNEMETMETSNEIKDLETKINDFASEMETLESEIAALKASIADSTTELQQANKNRVAQNQLFQQTVADQRATQVILTKALDRLAKFYAEFVQLKTSAHKQEPGAAAPPPPPGFSEYKSNSGSGAVMTMIGNVIQDAKESEKEAISAENDAQAAYEGFQAESYAAIEAAQRAVTNKTEQKAKAESSKVAAEGDKDAATATAESLAATNAQLHQSCDFVLQNFEARQAARTSEVESLQNALSALRSA
jgi:chromosome segregation ATPase